MKYNFDNDKEAFQSAILISDEEKPCTMCGEMTRYIDYFSEGRMCSEECMSELDKLVAENESR